MAVTAAGPLDTEAAAFRGFNRFYTRRIGVLGEGLLDSPFSLTEARVLYELAQRKTAAATELADALALDPGYLSRILRGFERKRYLRRTPSHGDGRRRDLGLTVAGRSAFAALDQRSQDEAVALLETLDAAARARLGEAMQAMREILDGRRHPVAAAVALRELRAGDLGWAIQRHGELYAAEYGWDREFEILVAGIAATFARRADAAREHGWIAECDGRRSGCVFLTRHSDRIAKLRLLLVEPDARGLGLGRRLIETCIGFAREAGYRKLTLWTQSNLAAARHLYERAGFRLQRRRPHHSFGCDLVAETWTLQLAAMPRSARKTRLA